MFDGKKYLFMYHSTEISRETRNSVHGIPRNSAEFVDSVELFLLDFLGITPMPIPTKVQKNGSKKFLRNSVPTEFR